METITIAILSRCEISRLATRLELGSSQQYEIIAESNNGAEGVRLVEQLRPDAVLLELSLIELDGIETTREMKRIAPTVKIIALSAWDSEYDLRLILAAGADGYIRLEDRTDGLQAALKTVFERTPTEGNAGEFASAF